MTETVNDSHHYKFGYIFHCRATNEVQHTRRAEVVHFVFSFQKLLLQIT